MVTELNRLIEPDKEFLCKANRERVSGLINVDEATNALLRISGRELNYLAHFNQEMWENIVRVVKSSTDKIDDVVSNLGEKGNIAETYITYLKENIVPLQKTYGRKIEGSSHYFYSLERKGFHTPYETIEDPLALGRLVNQGKIDVTCLDPFTFLNLFKKN